MGSDPAPHPHASAEEVEAARSDPKLANVLYHDWEADSYDEKWSISYDERCIDYAVGHGVLHHIPDLLAAFREILRVLKPGGRFVFAGEPTKIGDWYARRLGRVVWWLTTNVTRLSPLRGWRRPQAELDESSRAAAL